jgi:hypothetical protein
MGIQKSGLLKRGGSETKRSRSVSCGGPVRFGIITLQPPSRNKNHCLKPTTPPNPFIYHSGMMPMQHSSHRSPLRKSNRWSSNQTYHLINEPSTQHGRISTTPPTLSSTLRHAFPNHNRKDSAHKRDPLKSNRESAQIVPLLQASMHSSRTMHDGGLRLV